MSADESVWPWARGEIVALAELRGRAATPTSRRPPPPCRDEVDGVLVEGHLALERVEAPVGLNLEVALEEAVGEPASQVQWVLPGERLSF